MKPDIRNATKTSADLYFYGDIVDAWWGAWDDMDQYPANIKNFLDGVKDVTQLNIYINSGGGSVFAGMAIYHMLRRHKAHKTVYVDGLAASIASVIALSGDDVIIPSNAYFMIHKPWTYAMGNSTDLLKMAEDLEKIEEGMLNIYYANMRSENDRNKVKDMVQNETWLTGEDAAKFFRVSASESKQIAASTSGFYQNYKNTPKVILDCPEPVNPGVADGVFKAKAKLKLFI